MTSKRMALPSPPIGIKSERDSAWIVESKFIRAPSGSARTGLNVRLALPLFIQQVDRGGGVEFDPQCHDLRGAGLRLAIGLQVQPDGPACDDRIIRRFGRLARRV